MDKAMTLIFSILVITILTKSEYEEEGDSQEKMYSKYDHGSQEYESKILSCFLFTNMQMKKDNVTISSIALSIGDKNKYIDKVFISMIDKCLHKITIQEINDLSIMAKNNQNFNFEKYVMVNYYSIKNNNLQFTEEELKTLKKIQTLTKKLENLKDKLKKPEPTNWLEFLYNNSIGILLWFIVLIIISYLSLSCCINSDQETEKLMELLKQRKEEFEQYDKLQKEKEKAEKKENEIKNNQEKIQKSNSNLNKSNNGEMEEKEKSSNKIKESSKDQIEPQKEKDYFDNRNSMYDVD